METTTLTTLAMTEPTTTTPLMSVNTTTVYAGPRMSTMTVQSSAGGSTQTFIPVETATSSSTPTSASPTPACPQFVVVAQETPIEPFSGTREQRELRMFLDDLEDLWEQRPDLTSEAKSRRTWGLLAGPVRRELRTQGLGPEATYQRLVGALNQTYGDRRPVSQLMTAFYTCCQEGYETVRCFSQRLHDHFTALTAAQKRDGVHPVETSQLSSRLIEGLRCANTRQWLRQSLVMRPEMTFLELREQGMAMEPEAAQVSIQAISHQAAPREEHEHSKVLQQLTAQMLQLTTAVKTLSEQNEELQGRLDRRDREKRQPGPGRRDRPMNTGNFRGQ